MTTTSEHTAPVIGGGDVHDLLNAAVGEAQRLNTALDDIIDQPEHRRSPVVRRSSIVGSSPAWHVQAAYLVTDLARIARQLEARLRSHVSGHARPRGGSDRNTALALQALPALAQGAGHQHACDVWRALDGWCQRARTVLGEVEPLELLPRQPGGGEPRCPWCLCQTLRYQRYAGTVRCINPECLDQDGQRPLARIEIGRASGETLLAWRDGSTGLPGVYGG